MALKIKSTKKRVSGNLSTDEENDFKFLASQQSNGSDDQDFEMVLAKHYAAIREKKKKEKEHKFLKLAYRQLSKEVSTPVEDGKSSIQTLESIFEDFLQKYAANEDIIHKLWTQVHKERQKFLTFAQGKLTTNVEAADKIEAGLISGLSRTHTACRELRGIIHQILPDN